MSDERIAEIRDLNCNGLYDYQCGGGHYRHGDKMGSVSDDIAYLLDPGGETGRGTFPVGTLRLRVLPIHPAHLHARVPV